MSEAQKPGVQTKTMKRVVTIAVLRVTTHGMTHISRMDAYLILAPRLQLEFHQ
jgi:hypothetical protein